MLRFLILFGVVALTASCKDETTSAQGRLGQMAKSNAKFVGYLYSADQPYVLVAFHNGDLRWRSDPQRQSASEGQAQAFGWPDRACLGFEQKNLSMPARAPERYLVCEAIEPFEHRNHLPRSQDFSFKRGDLFLEYQPPEGTGFPQIYYLSEQK